MENASEAIYIGVYTMIFVIALSLTIFLYSSLMNYSQKAYDYMQASGDNSVLVNAPVNRNLLISGEEVVSYYYNYIKKDRFSDPNYNSNINVSINLHTSNEEPLLLEDKNLTYKQLIEKIGMNDQYILTVNDHTNNENIYINLVKATPEQIQEEW